MESHKREYAENGKNSTKLEKKKKHLDTTTNKGGRYSRTSCAGHLARKLDGRWATMIE